MNPLHFSFNQNMRFFIGIPETADPRYFFKLFKKDEDI